LTPAESSSGRPFTRSMSTGSANRPCIGYRGKHRSEARHSFSERSLHFRRSTAAFPISPGGSPRRRPGTRPRSAPADGLAYEAPHALKERARRGGHRPPWRTGISTVRTRSAGDTRTRAATFRCWRIASFSLNLHVRGGNRREITVGMRPRTAVGPSVGARRLMRTVRVFRWQDGGAAQGTDGGSEAAMEDPVLLHVSRGFYRFDTPSPFRRDGPLLGRRSENKGVLRTTCYYTRTYHYSYRGRGLHRSVVD